MLQNDSSRLARRIGHKLRMVALALRADVSPAPPREKIKILRIAGNAFVADPSGCLFWPDERLLVVADLHLEKGSAYAARRVFLPPYDTTATLARLAEVIDRLAPRRVIALGDSFHDTGGASRLLPHDILALSALQRGRDWLWIAGNHDPAPPRELAGDHAAELAIGSIRFRHEPSEAASSREDTTSEIAGHMHPAAIVGGRGAAVRRRCFLADASRCILPAFGAYAGGLNILDPAFHRLFGSAERHAHVLGHSAVYTVGRHQCLAEHTGLGWR